MKAPCYIHRISQECLTSGDRLISLSIEGSFMSFSVPFENFHENWLIIPFTISP